MTAAARLTGPRIVPSRVIWWIVLLAVTRLVPAAGQSFETPTGLAPASVLPAESRTGEAFTVRNPVRHDGFVYIYDVDSPFGAFQAEGTAQLRTLIGEINAIAALKQLKNSETFKNAVAESGKGALQGMKELVTSPVGTLKEAGSGLGRMFKRAGESVRSDKSDTEDSTLKAVLGVSKIKRQYAQHLGIDPYSRNSVLQDELDSVAWTAFSGGLGVTALTAMVPGAVGAFASFSGNANMLQNKIYATTPEDLRAENRNALIALGVDKKIANVFIDNGNFSPTDQTLLVGALSTIAGARNHSAFVAWAATTPDPEIAFVRRRMAEMLAGEHARAPIVEIRDAGAVPAALDKAGNVIVCLPADRILWTRDLAPVVDDVTKTIDEWTSAGGRILVLDGTLSSQARREFIARGWTIRENSWGSAH